MFHSDGWIVILKFSVQVFSKNYHNPDERNEMEDDVKFWSLLFVALAVVMLIGHIVQVREIASYPFPTVSCSVFYCSSYYSHALSQRCSVIHGQ